MDTMQQRDEAAAAVQKTPNRVTLEYIKSRVADVEYMHPATTPTMTIAVATMVNGFVVIGKSAPADPENFDAELGRRFSLDDCISQMWALEGFALRERLANAAA